MTTSVWARVALACTGWAALAATLLPAGSPARVAIVAVFLVTCPGAAVMKAAAPILARHGHALSTLEVLALTVALSLSLAVLAAAAFQLGGVFTATRVLGVLAVLTSAGALTPTARSVGSD